MGRVCGRACARGAPSTPSRPRRLAVPDGSSLTPLPWQPEVGWLSCNLVHEGSELAHGPRNVLRGVQAKLGEHGVTLKTGVECEFFLIDGSPTGGPALSDPADLQSKPCYDAHALMRRYELISSLVTHMEGLGWGPYQADHEDANGQFEINWDYNGGCCPPLHASVDGTSSSIDRTVMCACDA